MLIVKLLVAAVAGALLVPVTWTQLSPPSNPYNPGITFNQAQSANDVWTWTDGDVQVAARGPIAITAVVPNRNPKQLATVSDISIWTWGLSSPFDPSIWWIRDGNTNKILFSGAMVESHGPNQNAGKDSVHLTTPLVLDPSGPNAPVIEFGPTLGTPSTASFQYSCSVIGRYVWRS